MPRSSLISESPFMISLGVISKWMLASSRELTFLPQPQFSTPAGLTHLISISLVSLHHPGYISSSPFYVTFPEIAHHKEVVPEHQVSAHIKKWSCTHLFMGMASFKRRNCSFKDSCITHCCVIITLFVDRGDGVT